MRKVYILWVVVFGLMFALNQTNYTSAQAEQSILPQPPVMTNDKLLSLIGQGSAQVSLMSEYIRSLESTITKLDTENKQLKDLKTPPPCETSNKKGN